VFAEKTYPFKHALLREAAYQLQLPGERGRLHACALGALEDFFGGRPGFISIDEGTGWRKFEPHPSDTSAADLAHHAHHADVAEEAVRRLYLGRAAEVSRLRHRHLESASFWLEVADTSEGRESCRALLNAGFATRIGVLEGDALAQLGGLHVDLGRMDQAEAEFNQALTLLRAEGTCRLVAAHLISLANLYRETG
jgi:hypothetical protein